MEKKYSLLFVAGILACNMIIAQAKTGNDVTTPLHLMKPDYPVPYGAPIKGKCESSS